MFKIFVVDDDPIVTDVILSNLEADYDVETFDSAEACLLRLESEKPNMFLLDVSLPGMDGYELCRWIKGNEELGQLPITFVSSHDTIEERLIGYDAGGQDFIVKPFAPQEILRKVKVAQNLVENDLAKDNQTQDARNMAMMFMANMDETGYVLAFMRQLIAYETTRDVENGLLELAQKYGLDAVVQTRVAKGTHTVSGAGANIPLEVAVLNHIQAMDRVFEFRRRSAYNFKYVTLMINNMPVDNPDFCGRLRDHLCFAAEAVDSRLRAIELEKVNQLNETGIGTALKSIHSMIDLVEQGHRQDKAAANELMFAFDQSLAKAFVHLGMTIGQENFLTEIIGDFTKQLVDVSDRGEKTHQALHLLGDQLGELGSVGSRT